MNTVSGIIVTLITAVLYLKYRPRLRSSLQICFMSGILGVVPFFLTDGPVLLQVIQHVLQATVLLCCFIKLRQEKIIADRRKARLKGCRRRGTLAAKEQPQVQSRACA